MNNPAFMWAACGAACRGLGLRDPLAEVDEKARAGASPSSQVLELSFGRNAHFAPLRIVLRPDLSPKTVAAVVAAVGRGTAAAATFYRNEAVPREPPGQCGDILCGPYSLIQGRLPTRQRQPLRKHEVGVAHLLHRLQDIRLGRAAERGSQGSSKGRSSSQTLSRRQLARSTREARR